MIYLEKLKMNQLLLGLIAICIYNCKSANTDGTGNITNSDSVDATSPEMYISDSIHEKNPDITVNYLFPSPGEILEEILVTEIDYNPKILNPVKNVSNYLEVKQEALNLGIYLSDLAYTNLYGDQNTALTYLKTVKDLALKLNIYKVVDEHLYERVQNNLSNKDSISLIINEMYGDIRDLLENSYRNNIYALIASGALIEALYISAMSVSDFTEYKAIANNIFEQKHLLNNFYAYASQYNHDSNVKEVLKLFENYKSIMEQSQSKTSPVKVSTEKGKLKIKGGEEITVTEENFKLYKDNIIKTRQSIVEAKN